MVGRWWVVAFMLLALVAIATAVEADRDPATGDYAWVDAPSPGTGLPALSLLEGRAGNDLVVPFIGDEGAFQAGDEPGDNTYAHDLLPEETRDEIPDNTTGTDIGNVFVSYDDGDNFTVTLRLYEQPPIATETARVDYMAYFTHARTDVQYRLTTYREAASPVWIAGLEAFDDSAGVWCGADQDASDGLDAFNAHGIFVGWSERIGGAGGHITWTVPYNKLNLTGAPTGTCGTFAATGTALVGDWLEDWKGESAQRAQGPSAGGLPSPSIATSGGLTSDVTQTPGTDFQLGGGVGFPPAPPYAPITIRVNGATVGTATGSPTSDSWFFILDISSIDPLPDCSYRVKAIFGTAEDEKIYLAPDCSPDSVVRFGIDELRRASGGVASGKASGSTNPPPQSPGDDADLDGVADGQDGCRFEAHLTIQDECDWDWDDDDVYNYADNCPRTVNPDQLDTDRDGHGDACMPDADGDGWTDALDNCPTYPNPAQVDLDRDGIGNLCDDDADGDGVPYNKEPPEEDCNKIWDMDPTEWSDIDEDCVGDNSDEDIDGDGVANDVEVQAGTDPYDSSSQPEKEPDVRAQPEQVGSIGGLGSTLLLLGLVAVGVLLFLVLRPKD